MHIQIYLIMEPCRKHSSAITFIRYTQTLEQCSHDHLKCLTRPTD
jgi:hypothetical protein